MPRIATRNRKPPPLLIGDGIQGIPVGIWSRPPRVRELRSKAFMGLFKVGCKVENPAHEGRAEVIGKLLVDTGSDFTWIHEDVLKRLGIPVRKTVHIEIANGQIVTRPVGFAVLHVHKAVTTDEVVFAQADDLQLLGARALEGLNLLVDPKRKRLVPGGPKIAASAKSTFLTF